MNFLRRLKPRMSDVGQCRITKTDSQLRKKFYAEHEGDSMIHQAAMKYFDTLGITNLSAAKSLREEYVELLGQKQKVYAAYKQVRRKCRSCIMSRAI